MHTAALRVKAQLTNWLVVLKSKEVTPRLVARTDMRSLLSVALVSGCGLSSAIEPYVAALS